MSATLVWFRADLRLHDNPALWHALSTAGSRKSPLLAIFCLTPQQWLDHDQGPNQLNFLLRNLASLRQDLLELNIPLKLIHAATFAELPSQLARFCREYQVEELFYNEEYQWNERQRDQAVHEQLQMQGVQLHSYQDQVLFTPGRLLTGKGDYYTVFTPFYRQWIQRLDASDLQPLPKPPAQAATAWEADPLPESLTELGLDSGNTNIQQLWPAGETAALEQLAAFCEQSLHRYKELRDFPALEATSRLSPALAQGLISPRQALTAVWQATQGRLTDKESGAGTWVAELVWREFYRHLQIGFPRVSRGRAFKTPTEKLAWRSLQEDRVQEDLEAWKAGQTGFPLVDAAMRQLQQTGWMHNRLRMLTAMFLSKHLLIDWRIGEAYFMQQLIDADLASNNGGWQWAASTGTDAVPYFRLFNPYRQSERFDPQGDFIRRYLPELKQLQGKAIHQPPVHKNRSDLFAETGDYPPPRVDLKAARERVLAAFEAIKPS
ncbi:deoxyribodipyrimidine photo-lyase [Marinospirillum perlucidum]|uniref:deoxyribodipyrimidine photo-lyase n=1 Tax=Marinospirillum perlucidum TaxID=1982602 RepID=UPI000DF35CB8|nr:deoxyribodipyrimidine photo-lyase [Marinospirillum perlucidum]